MRLNGLRTVMVAIFLVTIMLLGTEQLFGTVIMEWNFNAPNSLANWKVKKYRGPFQNNYKWVQLELTPVNGGLLGEMNKSSHGLYCEFDKTAVRKGMKLHWRWKIDQYPVKNPNASMAKNADDFACRIYLVFPSMLMINTHTLSYVADEYAPAGTTRRSFFSSNIQVQVAPSKKGVWTEVIQDITDDYFKAFNESPPKMGAIAVLVESDNTQSAAKSTIDFIRIEY